MHRTVIAALAVLMLAGCGKKDAVGNTADANAMVTEMSAAEALEGTTNDSMTNIDAAAGTTDPATLNSGTLAASAANAASESDKPAKVKTTIAKPAAPRPKPAATQPIAAPDSTADGDAPTNGTN